MSCQEIQELLPAFAIGAADADEKRLVRQHLATCAGCRRELDSYWTAVDSLALSAPPAIPSARLRERVLEAASPPARRREGRRAWGLAWLAPGGLLTRLSPLVAALALFIAVGASVQSFQLQAELAQQKAANQALSAEVSQKDRLVALLGPGMVTRELAGTAAAPGAEAYIYFRPESQSAYLMAEGLPALPGTQVYQLWLIRDGTRRSGGTFSPHPDGTGRLAIEAPEALSAYQAIGITVEPAGGSPGPTGQRVLAGSL